MWESVCIERLLTSATAFIVGHESPTHEPGPSYLKFLDASPTRCLACSSTGELPARSFKWKDRYRECML